MYDLYMKTMSIPVVGRVCWANVAWKIRPRCRLKSAQEKCVRKKLSMQCSAWGSVQKDILLLRIFMNSFPAFKPFQRLCIQYQISHVIFRPKKFRCMLLSAFRNEFKQMSRVKMQTVSIFCKLHKGIHSLPGKKRLNIFSDILFRHTAV